MTGYIIIETDDGMTVVEVLPGQDPNDVALSNNGNLADDQLYSNYQDAYDALIELSEDEDNYEESAY